jgi:two-component system CheB/CheR fusion protein
MPRHRAPPIIAEKSTVAFPIVGIGASAGGLEAFEQFFRNCPVNSGMAFVLVSHLDPSHASLLTEILQRSTTMSVVEALDQVPVEPNSVYVIPPNRDLAIFHGNLQVTMPAEPRGQRMPIDTFLRSLADDQQDLAIGIILSGTGSDGTLGLRAIHGAGGITMAQEPASSKYSGMPTSAIQTGYVTHIASVDKMSELLVSSTHKLTVHSKASLRPETVSALNLILMQLRTVTGHDFSLYKKSTIGRRIERRMMQNNIEDIKVYARYLKENASETRILFKELLINVTNFFRDKEAFAVLQKTILPQLCRDKPDDYVFRIWLAGCATGEEAYSMAILLRELIEETHQQLKIQIYSTDLDEDAIAIARTGVYPFNIAQDVTPERLRRFFVKDESGYRVRKELREMVVFAIHNVIKDPPFTKLDLLSCRNLMIYLEPEAQSRLIPAFHYALKPGGVLFLATSESIGNYTDLFSALDRKWKFYQAKHITDSLDVMLSAPFSRALVRGRKPPAEPMASSKMPTSYAELANQALLQSFAPAAIITDPQGNILYVHGDTGKYLCPAPGQASLNAIEMAREGLNLSVPISAAASAGVPMLDREMQVKTNGGYTTVSLSVQPLSGPDGSQNLLVSFQDIASPAAKPLRKRVIKSAERGRIEELERDLEYLTESYQATVEELKSTNEEMQSTNEEVQSTNEELETSKEELQSVNEELLSVNAELHAKIEQLICLQNDMKNLVDNINVGIIILDQNLVIRSFTSEATRIYPLVASDVGRHLNDFKSHVETVDLVVAAQTVLDSLTPYEQEIQIHKDIWMLTRIQPYRTLDNAIDGVVLTFTDISIKALALQEALMLANGIVNMIREPLLLLDDTLKVISASQAFYREFQVSQEESIGQPIYELGKHQWDIPALRELLERYCRMVYPLKVFWWNMTSQCLVTAKCC